ncbi:1-(5-phosphoribosyl)-5-[(5-phosphoribosylamino)methylideneamino]imidazole-4-carboxamide isomerase [Prochlorococcus sp. MIT 1341]|uniref:1-(5-phosphoribosyl)-5-[(5- phosphoribosylamino)methylideneamino]imidazole-4- carboxamide isomerase n=1 Tax=Prochlorococcus sp. MIT 1341 TaxID=3096221 RepID=UPI002A75FEA2|nr:1-(5-phosphoribosyl)-5-[(5-phosphoribosylamino)methylideneamino]imidazole-4-carboxamide isomerase [Prochlorococcus sp. MIT 1341]
MEIIPAIDLLNGTCVRLNQGNYERVTQFNKDPVAQALSWQKQGASRLHLVDLDGARSGKPVNDSSIKKIASALEIPVQIGGGIRSVERAEALIDLGLDKIILGTLAIDKPQSIKSLAKKHPERIIVGIDSKKGKVATQGWLNESNVLATELAKYFNDSDIASIITTDIETDGTLKGPNLKAMRSIANVSKKPVIASGGVGSMSDLLSLLSLEALGVTGVIVGRALYDGRVDLKEAKKALGENKLQDFPQGLNSFA